MGIIVATFGKLFRRTRRVGALPSMKVEGGHKRPPYAARPLVKPLRVVHSGSGRLVISGRMADVCAELDRLAAIEARGAQVLAPAR